MSEDPTKILPTDSTVLQEILSELRALRGEVRALDARVFTVEEKLEVRSRETQPMSDRVDRLLAEVAASRQELRDETTATRRELREINRTLRRMNVDVARALDIQTDLEDRIIVIEDKLELTK